MEYLIEAALYEISGFFGEKIVPYFEVTQKDRNRAISILQFLEETVCLVFAKKCLKLLLFS